MDIEKLEHQTENNIANALNVRCPGCFKLFAVKEVEIQTSKPEFQCNKCHQNFWISYPECKGVAEILGYPGAPVSKSPAALHKEPAVAPEFKISDHKLNFQEPEAEVTSFDCPKCEAKYKGGDKECMSCGIVFEQYNKILTRTAAFDRQVKPEVLQAWDAIADHYEDKLGHQDFLAVCKRNNCLDFAAHKYALILGVDSGDEIANQMQKQIKAISIVEAGLPLEKNKEEKVTTRFRWTFITMGLGIAMIAIGYFVPQFRNMVGVGVALTFLTLGLRVYFK